LRIAVVSDIHGNLTALEAVLADLEAIAPDLVVHGGDLCSGSKSAAVIDRIRELGWPGVYGNTDETLWVAGKADEYLARVGLHRMREIVAEQTAFTLAEIGADRLAWLRALPIHWAAHDLAVVHANPGDTWGITAADASDEELERTYGPLASRRVVYGHIHRPFVRRLTGFILGNSGCLSLSYDGDPRAAYAVVDDDGIAIRRVEYDIEREAAALVESGFPYARWMAAILRTAAYIPPPGLLYS
jgi:putative phosphoesterase